MRAIVNLILTSTSVFLSHCAFEEGSQTKIDTSEEAGPSTDPMVLKYIRKFEIDRSTTKFNMNGIAYLANMLGYGWAGGCPFGTGFTNDVWQAKQIDNPLADAIVDDGDFHQAGPCSASDCLAGKPRLARGCENRSLSTTSRIIALLRSFDHEYVGR